MWYTTKAITITSRRAITTGGTSNDFDIRFSSTVVAGGGTSAMGNAIAAGTGGAVPTAGDLTIPANNYIFYDGGTVSGVVTRFHVSFEYTED
jgi:hypothetical protein